MDPLLIEHGGEDPDKYEGTCQIKFRHALLSRGDPEFSNWRGYRGTGETSKIRSDDAAYRFTNHNPGIPVPPFVNNCICGHYIEEQCYIIHKNFPKNYIPSDKTCDKAKVDPNHAYVSGNCCITKFFNKEDYLKTCVQCKKLYPGPYDNCARCDEEIERARLQANANRLKEEKEHLLPPPLRQGDQMSRDIIDRQKKRAKFLRDNPEPPAPTLSPSDIKLLIYARRLKNDRKPIPEHLVKWANY